MSLRLLCLSLFLALGCLAAAAQGVPYPYSVALSWKLSISPGITGQNVYRAPYTTTCGTFALLNSSPISATAVSYTDATVVPNSAYCFEVTVIGVNGESGPSNVLSNIQIPPAPDTGLSGTTQ
jgi:hypothetical protein